MTQSGFWNGRRIGLGAVLAAAALWALPASMIGTNPTPVNAQATGDTCRSRPGVLGVSRVVEIDTANGARFGQLQYQDNDFLREGEVVLTFDDGPLRKHSRMVLEALGAHCTQATFFMVGQMALSDPEMVREIERRGHTIAIHTWSHKNLRSAGAANAAREIELGISAVQKALGHPVAPFFRFPYLADSQAMHAHLASRNFGTFSIDVDSRDFRTQDPRKMQRQVMDALAPKKKGILLFHDIQFSTAHGIRAVLDELAAKGYRVVHTVPKNPALSQHQYDAMAEAEFSRRNKVATTQPMATRSVVWPMTPPGVQIEQYQPGSTAAVAARPQPKLPAARQPALPAAGAQPPQAIPAVAAQPAPAIAPPPVQQAAPQAERPTFRGTSDDDWRARIFQQ
jgi:peptidoglycan-N-acetylglucosamine deacetylase